MTTSTTDTGEPDDHTSGESSLELLTAVSHPNYQASHSNYQSDEKGDEENRAGEWLEESNPRTVASTSRDVDEGECTNEEDSQDDESLLLAKRRRESQEFELVCRMVIAFGVAAMKYGTSASQVEQFMDGLMRQFGYAGCVFRATQGEIFCCFQRPPDEEEHDARMGAVFTQIVAISPGLNMHKLGMLAEYAKECVNDPEYFRTEVQATLDKLDEIEASPDPWDGRLVGFAFVAVGGSLAMLLEGSWWDALVGAINGGIVFFVLQLFAKFPAAVSLWKDFAAAAACAFLATLIKSVVPAVNVTLVTLSGVAIQVPGFDVSLGTYELISSHVVSGAARLIRGMVTMLWLVMGLWLGKTFGDALVDVHAADHTPEPVPFFVALIFLPFLLVSVTFVFQNSRRDVPWACLGMAVTFATSYAFGTYVQQDLGTFLSALVMTVFANAWARAFDRPYTLVLLPSFVLKVSGSIGFLGLIKLIDGEAFVGTQQFLQMFVVALLIIAGIFAGNALLLPNTTL